MTNDSPQAMCLVCGGPDTLLHPVRGKHPTHTSLEPCVDILTHERDAALARVRDLKSRVAELGEPCKEHTGLIAYAHELEAENAQLKARVAELEGCVLGNHADPQPDSARGFTCTVCQGLL